MNLFGSDYMPPFTYSVDSKTVKVGCEGGKNDLKILYVNFIRENIKYSILTSRAIETEHCQDWIKEAKQILRKNKKVTIKTKNYGSISSDSVVYFHPIISGKNHCLSYFPIDCEAKKSHD